MKDWVKIKTDSYRSQMRYERQYQLRKHWKNKDVFDRQKGKGIFKHKNDYEFNLPEVICVRLFLRPDCNWSTHKGRSTMVRYSRLILFSSRGIFLTGWNKSNGTYTTEDNLWKKANRNRILIICIHHRPFGQADSVFQMALNQHSRQTLFMPVSTSGR